MRVGIIGIGRGSDRFSRPRHPETVPKWDGRGRCRSPISSGDSFQLRRCRSKGLLNARMLFRSAYLREKDCSCSIAKQYRRMWTSFSDQKPVSSHERRKKWDRLCKKGHLEGERGKKDWRVSLCVCYVWEEEKVHWSEEGEEGRKEGGLMSPPLRLGLGLALEGGGGGGRGGGVFFSLTFLTIRNHTRGVSLPSSSSFCFFEEETPVYVRRREGERNSQRRTSSNGEL